MTRYLKSKNYSNKKQHLKTLIIFSELGIDYFSILYKKIDANVSFNKNKIKK